ncbi:MAG: GNAT family N-acetyltransferase [Pirellulaceae bacterium]|nr:GNAT family N-acetyltransferase [Pirellulaceae bacterium]
MEKTIIVELLDRPEFIPTAVRWIRKEWPDSRDDSAIEDRLCGSRRRDTLPLALVAVLGSTPIGFVSLTLYENGIKRGRPHWIDALYVEPAYRGQGIARQLVHAAEEKSVVLGLTELFALTEIPRLYHKCGWNTVEEFTTPNGRDFIVARRLAD